MGVFPTKWLPNIAFEPTPSLAVTATYSAGGDAGRWRALCREVGAAQFGHYRAKESLAYLAGESPYFCFDSKLTWIKSNKIHGNLGHVLQTEDTFKLD